MDEDRIVRVRAQNLGPGIFCPQVVDEPRLSIRRKGSMLYAVCISLSVILLSSCSSMDIKREVQVPREGKEIPDNTPPRSELKTPDFVPVTEDVSPLKTRIMDIIARSTPLKDVLHVISEATGLNLVIQKGVNLDTPITLTLRNVIAEDALVTIFMSVDYFYSVKDNMLIVKAVDTRIFELGYPAIIQTYSVDVGGDILGGVASSVGSAGGTGGTTGTGGSTGTGSSGLSSLKGNITQSQKSDQTAFSFWDAIEKSIANILGSSGGQALTPSPTNPPSSSATTASVQNSFTVNRLAGTIVVTATKNDIERVEQYINTIKRVMNRQVLVEAKVIEVQLSEGLKYGIDWSALDFNKLGQITVGASKFSDVIGSTTPSFQIGVSKWNFTSLLKAIQQQGEVRTLSNPRLNIMNGHTAILSVGSSISFVTLQSVLATTTTGTTTTTGIAAMPTVSSVLSGLSIGIVPYISENGEISLTITPLIADVIKFEPQTVNGAQISVPTINIREMSTTVKVRDGQMVIIGGLIQNKENLQDNRIPGLGSVPAAGGLFRNRDKSESRTELVVVLQPILLSR